MLQYPKGIANSDNAFYKNRKIIFMAINGQSLVDRGKYYYDTKNNTFQGDGSEEARCLITLPMPNNLQDDQRHNWSETDYMSALSNVVSVIVYLFCIILCKSGHIMPVYISILLEVACYSALGVYYIGWKSGSANFIFSIVPFSSSIKSC